jgi:hypothetical protein
MDQGVLLHPEYHTARTFEDCVRDIERARATALYSEFNTRYKQVLLLFLILGVVEVAAGTLTIRTSEMTATVLSSVGCVTMFLCTYLLVREIERETVQVLDTITSDLETVWTYLQLQRIADFDQLRREIAVERSHPVARTFTVQE